MAPQGAEGRHDREEQFARVRLCREACTSDGRLNGKCSAGDETISATWIAGRARNDSVNGIEPLAVHVSEAALGRVRAQHFHRLFDHAGGRYVYQAVTAALPVVLAARAPAGYTGQAALEYGDIARMLYRGRPLK